MPEHYEREEKPPLPSAPPLDDKDVPRWLLRGDERAAWDQAAYVAVVPFTGRKAKSRARIDMDRLRTIASLRAALAAAEKEREELQTWKADAMKVLLAYDDVIRPHGRLGELLTDTAARIVDERDAARREARELREMVDRLDSYLCRNHAGDGYMAIPLHHEVRALLAAKEDN